MPDNSDLLAAITARLDESRRDELAHKRALVDLFAAAQQAGHTLEEIAEALRLPTTTRQAAHQWRKRALEKLADKSEQQETT